MGGQALWKGAEVDDSGQRREEKGRPQCLKVIVVSFWSCEVIDWMACFIGSGCGSLSLSRRPCRGGRWVCRVEGEEGEGGGGKGEKVSVVVAGATGRTGRLVIKELLKREEGGRKIRAVVRDRQAAEKLLGSDDRLEYVVADVRRNDDALKDAFKDAKYLVSREMFTGERIQQQQ